MRVFLLLSLAIAATAQQCAPANNVCDFSSECCSGLECTNIAGISRCIPSIGGHEGSTEQNTDGSAAYIVEQETSTTSEDEEIEEAKDSILKKVSEIRERFRELISSPSLVSLDAVVAAAKGAMDGALDMGKEMLEMRKQMREQVIEEVKESMSKLQDSIKEIDLSSFSDMMPEGVSEAFASIKDMVSTDQLVEVLRQEAKRAQLQFQEETIKKVLEAASQAKEMASERIDSAKERVEGMVDAVSATKDKIVDKAYELKDKAMAAVPSKEDIEGYAQKMGVFIDKLPKPEDIKAMMKLYELMKGSRAAPGKVDLLSIIGGAKLPTTTTTTTPSSKPFWLFG